MNDTHNPNPEEEALRNREKGEKSEDRFYRLLSDLSKVPEINGIMPASPEENQRGVDFHVIMADDTTIHVDVKSSYKGKRKKRWGRLHVRGSVCVIFIREELDDDHMRRQIIEVLEKWKAKRLL